MKEKTDDLLVYDEDEAVKFILHYIKTNEKKEIDDLNVEYILDVIYDYYDEKGYIEDDTAEEASIDEEEMFQFLKKQASRDQMNISDEEIASILEAEYQYGQSLGIYN